MKRIITVLLAWFCLLALTACAAPATLETTDTSGDASPTLSTGETAPETSAEVTHVHTPPTDSNILPHEPAGYCGNTMTTVIGYPKEENTASFAGSESVALTDLLLYLDYREEACSCPPEFSVETEFGGPYEINLTEGFARYGDSQVNLTEEQIGEIRGILDRMPTED